MPIFTESAAEWNGAGSQKNYDAIWNRLCSFWLHKALYPQKVAAADGHALCDSQTETTSESHIHFVQTLVLFKYGYQF